MISALQKGSGTRLETVDEMVKRSLNDIGWLGKIDTDTEHRNPTPVVKITDYPRWIDNMTRVSMIPNNKMPCVFTNESNTGIFDSDQQKHNNITKYDIVVLVLKKAQGQFFDAYEFHLKERATCDSRDNPVVMRAFNLLVD